MQLEKSRKEAELSFQSLAMPSSREEHYRYLNLKALNLEGDFAATSPAGEANEAELEEGEGALLTVSSAKSQLVGDAGEAIFQDLASASRQENDFLAKRWKPDFADDKFAQLAAARWQNGIFLRVPKGVSLALPLRALQSLQGDHRAFRTFIIVEKGASLQFVEELSGDAAFVSGLTEIEVQGGARLRYVQVQRLGAETDVFLRQDLRVGAGASVEFVPIHLGGRRGQLRQHIRFLGAKAELQMLGAVRGSQEQQLDFWVDTDHSLPDTKSAMDFRFVMDGKSRASFNGLIHIGKEGKDTDASQRTRALLLSEKAEVHAIPKLIIETDAVKCAHGASISSLLPEQVHYLQSRGIPRNEAERMIVRGFLEPVLRMLPTEAAHDRLERLVALKENVLQ